MIKAIDLFAGAGGLSYGFYLTGEYELVAAAEINENARATYKQNIAKHTEGFEFINNVIGYDFGALNQRKGNEIDVVIGGPPCQGFSNANRQKNHLISMNNSLVKEYFRAIKQIRPKAFVMENVSMLESDTHRFYDSYKDNAEIEALIAQGFNIPKRMDSLVLTDRVFDDIDLDQLPQENLVPYDIPSQLKHLLSVLRKNLGNDRRLPNFLTKNATLIKRMILDYLAEQQDTTDEGTVIMTNKLSSILSSLPRQLLTGVVIGIIFFIVGGILIRWRVSFTGNTLYFIISQILVAFSEELLFRGYILAMLRDMMKTPNQAVIISALLFGLWHYPVSHNISLVLLTAFTGAVYGSLRTIFEKTDDEIGIVSLTTSHWLFNIIL